MSGIGTKMDNDFEFFEAYYNGLKPDEFLKQNLESKKQALKIKAMELQQALKTRLNDVKREIKQGLTDVKETPFLKASQEEVSSTKETLTTLTGLNSVVETELERTKKRTDQQNQNIQELVDSLNKLKPALANIPQETDPNLQQVEMGKMKVLNLISQVPR